MKEGGTGGCNTTTGLRFERQSDFRDLLSRIKGYELRQVSGRAGLDVLFQGSRVARTFRKGEFYHFLAEEKIDWKGVWSKRLFPDDAILVIVRDTLFIIEVKYQQVGGSVDEKLQTCDFKRKQYQKLFAGQNIRPEYVYVLSDWFRNPKYKDVLDYIVSVGCAYHFETLPLKWLGLPVPEGSEN